MDNNDFYLTLFSTENRPSAAFVSSSNLNEFEVELPHPINLNPNYNWEAGIVQFAHPACLYVSDERNKDIIWFRNYRDDDSHNFDLPTFGKKIAESVYNPALYTLKYLEEFYNFTNIASIGTADDKLKKYATNFTTSKHITTFSVDAWPIKNAVRNDSLPDSRVNLPHGYFYVFFSNVNYTLKQLLYSILIQTYNEMQTRLQRDATLINDDTVSLPEHLFHVMRTFIIHLYIERLRYFNTHVEGLDTYRRIFAVLHCDLITPSFFNSSFERVILTKLIRPLSTYNDNVMPPIKYYPISKLSFQTIKIKITNENLKLLHFVDDTSRICLVLHIKPIVH